MLLYITQVLQHISYVVAKRRISFFFLIKIKSHFTISRDFYDVNISFISVDC